MKDETRKWLTSFLEYLATTTDDSWCMNVYRTKDGKQNCLLGHLFEWAGNDYLGNEYLDKFDYIATDNRVFQVNDGTNDKYPQTTPKQRCIAFIKNILSGDEKTTLEMMEEY